MNSDQPSDDRMVADRDVPGQGRRVGHDQVVAQVTIVSHMDIGHEKVVVANRRHAPARHRATVHGHILPKNVVMADDHAGRLTFVLEMLGRGADGGIGIELTSFPNLGPALHVDMGDQAGSSADLDMLTDY